MQYTHFKKATPSAKYCQTNPKFEGHLKQNTVYILA